MSSSEKNFAGNLEQEMLQYVQLDSTGALSTGSTETAGKVESAVAIESARAVVKVVPWEIAGIADFNADGKDDVLFVDEKNSAMEIWHAGRQTDIGGQKTFYNELISGGGDFNGDNKADILFKNENGIILADFAADASTFTPAVVNLLDTGWSISGVGNFNGTGNDDILLTHPTAASETVGLLGYWADGTSWTLINGYSPEWEIVATDDFNNDGKTDMLWRNTFVGVDGKDYNAYCTWIVDNANDWRMVSVANPAEWNFLCAGDFNGDNMADIAMINDVGVVGIWGVNDGYLNSWSILSAVTSDWTLGGVGDFNGDNTDDIMWVNSDTLQVGYWQVKDKTLDTWVSCGSIA